MSPDAQYFNLPNYREFSAADHAAHTTRRGIHRAEDLIPGADSRKATKQIMKFARKPHLALKNRPHPTKAKRRKKL